jgi:hypothetical protein
MISNIQEYNSSSKSPYQILAGKRFIRKYPQFFFGIAIGVLLLFSACDKHSALPPFTSPAATNFSATSLNHTQDTVAVGDTIYLNAAGNMLDTTKNIYAYLTSSYSASGVSAVYDFGTVTSPVKLSRIIGAQNASGLYTWTSTIILTGATQVPSKTKLTIVANFEYQLSLSSEQGNLVEADAGVKNKTVFVQ